VPRYVAFIDELPRTESGKIKKFILREQGISAGCWDRLA
jgi:crotonobetaine/carnitine-CoA ligase